MNEEELNKMLANAQLQQQNTNSNTSKIQQQMQYQEMEKGLAEEQLDVEGIIYSLFNLLKGNKISFDDSGRRIWGVNNDKSLQILSENGIQRTMQIIVSYVNKLKMLSNHSNEEILKAMYDFTTELNDNVLMRYEDLFYSPSFEECKKILDTRLKEKIDIKIYSKGLIGETLSNEDAKKEVYNEIETRVEYELAKIKDEERKKRVKEYGMLILLIEHQVLDTYRRSEGGQERSTLRRHSNFSEIRAIGEPKQQGGMFSWLKN